MILEWIAALVVIGGLTALWRRRNGSLVSASGGVAAGRDIRDSTIIINPDLRETITGIERHLAKLASANATPGAAERVGAAVESIAIGAGEGDQRLQRALDLLRDGKVDDAVVALRAVAEDKTASIRKDSKDAAAAYRNLGTIAGLGDPKQALDAYQKAIAFDPDDAESLLWAGCIELERGDLDAAERRFRRTIALAGNEPDTRNVYWARLGLGDVRVGRGDLPAARSDYLQAMSIAERLAKADPGNAGWQRDLSVSLNKIGDVQSAQGDLAAALASFQASLAIAERLAKADPGNAGWQRDLSVSHEKIGDVQSAQGDLAAALASFQASLAIRERLAKADPGNAGWQRDLSVSLNKIGDVQSAQGDLAAALASFQAGLAIAERLAKADPGNAGWQRDVIVSCVKMSEIDQAGARAWLEQALRVAVRLAESRRLAPTDAWMPGDLQRRLAALPPG